MTNEVKFFIKRDDGLYYAGTNDKNPIWGDRRLGSGAFKTRDQAEQRTAGLTLTSDSRYEIEPGAVTARKAEEVRADSLKPGDCFEDEYETGYDCVGPGEKDGEPCVEAMRKFDRHIMLFHAEEQVYRITYE